MCTHIFSCSYMGDQKWSFSSQNSAQFVFVYIHKADQVYGSCIMYVCTHIFSCTHEHGGKPNGAIHKFLFMSEAQTVFVFIYKRALVYGTCVFFGSSSPLWLFLFCFSSSFCCFSLKMWSRVILSGYYTQMFPRYHTGGGGGCKPARNRKRKRDKASERSTASWQNSGSGLSVVALQSNTPPPFPPPHIPVYLGQHIFPNKQNPCENRLHHSV